MTETYAIEAIGLTQYYRSPLRFREFFRKSANAAPPALDNVSFALRHGEVFGLVGPNGAGKTTLINIFCTLLVPTAGTARIDGRDVVADSSAVRGHVGVVTSNERSFYWRLTGRQNLRFFADLYHIPPREAQPWIEELLERLGLADVGDRRFDMYSTGMRQRLAFARALLHRPKILFLDEPTRGLDPTNAEALRDLLEERIIQVWHPTILLTSHNLREVERLSDRIAIMDRGRILRLGTFAEIQRMEQFNDGYRITVRGLDGEGAERLARLEGVRRVWSPDIAGENGVCVVQIANAGNVLSRVLETLIRDGAEVVDCRQEEVSLEEIFSRVVQGNRET